MVCRVGPCAAALMTLADLGIVAGAFINDAGGDAMLTCTETGRCGWLGSSLLAVIGLSLIHIWASALAGAFLFCVEGKSVLR